MIIKSFKNMPRFDGTGPLGSGPGTGWGLGPCGAGRFNRGFRRFYSRQEESEILKEEVKVLEDELKAVKERLTDLKGQK
jgi:hypothetical protein